MNYPLFCPMTGQPEDKLKLMFNMYDIDRSGQLSRDEFRHMLK